MKIAITGGHITAAIAVIEKLQKYRDIDVVVIGRQFAVDYEKTESFEYKTLKEKGIRFVHIAAGRLTRSISLHSVTSFLKFPLGFIQAVQIIQKEKPSVVLSFGGYIALPVACVAYCYGIPLYTHEQTMRPGLTNRIIARFARKIFISFPDAAKYFPSEKTILTGNPIRSCIRSYKLPVQSRPLILVMGGSLGSHSINAHIENIIGQLINTSMVVHQTGNVEQFGDFERLKGKENEFYKVFEHFDDDTLTKYYSQSQLVVARAGANTVSELIVLEKPSVLIPLPWAGNGEQLAQAKFMNNAGVSEVFDQHQSSLLLLQKILLVLSNTDEFRKNFSTLKAHQDRITHAASNIVDHILHEKNT